MKILVVDDDKNVLYTVRALINSLGHFVETVDSGKEALEKLSSGIFELVFIDIRMPEMDGIELLKRIREKNIDIIPIILTAYGDMNAAIEALKFGAYDFLEKPVTREALRFSIERSIKRKELEEKNIKLKEYETLYLVWSKLINIHDFKNLLEEIPRTIFDAFEEKLKIFLIILKPFEEIYQFPVDSEYDLKILKELLDTNTQIKNEGLTKILKIKDTELMAKYFIPEKDLFFIIAAEIKEKLKKEEILKKFEFLCNNVSILITKNFLSYKLNEALEKLHNLHLHVIKTGSSSLMIEVGYELFNAIKNPIKNIESKIQIIKERVKDLPLYYLIDDLEKNVFELKEHFKLIDHTLEFSKFEIKKVNIDEIIGLSYMTLNERIKAKNIGFRRKGEENLTVKANPAALEISLIHIILNSIDALEFGGEIIVETEREKDYVRISVIDNGIGIDEEIIDKIFNPFFTTKRETGGTGLGLTLSKWLIERMEGNIKVESKKGLGTKVHIYLKSE
ncbi:MAG: response regulator [candidate division WOR-3 bacterium]